MAVNNNTNPPVTNPGGIESLNRAGTGSDSISSGNGLNENFDWFNVSDGKALPISAQSQFSGASSMDEMVSTMLGHLGFS